MNKILREEMKYLITCDDKAITPDVKDDVKITLDYIDELEYKINKAIEYINEVKVAGYIKFIDSDVLIDILRGEDNEDKS